MQITPTIGPGAGVASVAHHLEREWQRRGIETDRFTMTEARGDWLPPEGAGMAGKLAHLTRVVWFSTVGTVLARRYLQRHPDSLSICHNDALAGDVYVNHGILEVAMRARGHYLLRMCRNPLHLFTWLRDRHRYGRHGPHRHVVNLSATDDRLLRELNPWMGTPTTVIGNGVDLREFAPPTVEQRRAARGALDLAPDNMAILFVGHEFSRKGLPVVLDALRRLPASHRLVVVGGTPDMVEDLRPSVARLGVEDRVQLVGPVADPLPFLRAADVLTLPSAYEAFPLVVLEALACGVPVVATPTGAVPDLVRDGYNGYVVPAEPEAVADAIAALRALPRETLAEAARSSVLHRSWEHVAEEYLYALRHAHAREEHRAGT